MSTPNQNLLKSAIADAKTVRASALENAKAALLESFSPKMSEMLSKKIAEETQTAVADDDAFAKDGHLANPSGNNGDRNPGAVETVDEEYGAYDQEGNYRPNSMKLTEDGEEELPTEEVPGEESLGDETAPEIDPNAVELDVDPSAGQEVDVVDTGAGTVKDVSPAGDEGAPEIAGDDLTDDGEGEPEGLELESIIHELEAEAGAEVADPAPEISDAPEGEDDGKTVGISTPQVPDDVEVNFEDPEAGDDLDDVPDADDAPLDNSDEDDEEVNLEEILKDLENEQTLEEELTTKQPLKANTDKPQSGNWGSDRTGINKTPAKGGTEPALEKAASDATYGRGKGDNPGKQNFEEFGRKTNTLTENNKLKKQLTEAYNTVRYLQGKINEVNLLNAKLLYTNKLFRNYGLTNEQKLRIVEQLDLTKSVREVKLVYTTLAESFSFGSKSNKRVVPSNRVSITEGLASKPTPSTRSAKAVLTEGDEMAARFQKLAGIKSKKVLGD